MNMKIARFIVHVIISLPSGDYALYTASNGKRVWTKDRGYNLNDKVELTYDETGPKALTINGIEKQIQA